jgi:hypothetical protein
VQDETGRPERERAHHIEPLATMGEGIEAVGIEAGRRLRRSDRVKSGLGLIRPMGQEH